MGWEFRIFYAGNIQQRFVNHVGRLFPLLIAVPIETRYDVYVSCCDHIGAKVRGDVRSNEIELKIRKERTEDGLENWVKVWPKLMFVYVASTSCIATDHSHDLSNIQAENCKSKGSREQRTRFSFERHQKELGTIRIRRRNVH